VCVCVCVPYRSHVAGIKDDVANVGLLLQIVCREHLRKREKENREREREKESRERKRVCERVRESERKE
jgi:hypothetical protein